MARLGCSLEGFVHFSAQQELLGADFWMGPPLRPQNKLSAGSLSCKEARGCWRVPRIGSRRGHGRTEPRKHPALCRTHHRMLRLLKCWLMGLAQGLAQTIPTCFRSPALEAASTRVFPESCLPILIGIVLKLPVRSIRLPLRPSRVPVRSICQRRASA